MEIVQRRPALKVNKVTPKQVLKGMFCTSTERASTERASKHGFV